MEMAKRCEGWVLRRLSYLRHQREGSSKSEPPNGLPGGQRGQQFNRRFPELGMSRLGSDLGERFENKSSLMQRRMGNSQARFIDDLISKKHYIDIEVARALLAGAETAHGRFDVQRQLEQLARGHPGFNCRYTIQKPGLVGNVDGLGLIERGNSQQPSACFQLRKGGAQVGRTVSQIRAQRQIGDFTHSTSFAANAARIQQKLTGRGNFQSQELA